MTGAPTPPVAFIAIVPARLASTRLPDKPLADLAGKPMVVRVADRARASGATRVIVAHDDAAIAAAVEPYGHETMTTSTTHASGTDRIAEVVARLLADGSLTPDAIVVNVQGDEPLIDPALIATAAATLARADDCAMATACHAIDDPADLHNPNVVKVVTDANGRALYFSRAPIPWVRDPADHGLDHASDPSGRAMRHIGIYAYRASFLSVFTALPPAPIERLEALEQLRALWHGHRIAVFTTAATPAPGVDTPEDLVRVRALLAAPGRNAD